MQSAVLAIVNPSIRLSVRPSHADTCQTDSRYNHAVFTVG